MAKTILVIDDDRLIRLSLEHYLTDAGFSVALAENGQKGLEQALATHPDLIITDIRMPELDGLEMVEQIRKDEWGKRAHIMVMSTDDSTTAVNEAMQAGVTFYLSKSNLTPDLIAQQALLALN